LPTVALTVRGRSTAHLARGLAERGVVVGAGLQCAPLAHETLGTLPEGVLRFSFGPMNTEDDVDGAAAALRELLG
jgi:selenocysteine lyase/cysteine desulfurase